MSGFQILLLLLITMWTAYDVGGPQMLFSYYPAMLGLILGAVFGDVKTGLLIGGTLQLMSMGIAGIGASSVPDYAAATIVAVPIAITTGGGLEAGLLVGIPVAMLGVQFEIMLRICNGFISRWSQSACEKGDFKKMINVLYLSPILGTMITTIPVMMFTLLGIGVVNSVLEFLPDWFMGGLGLAGRLLPAVGLSILLQKPNCLHKTIPPQCNNCPL